MQHHRLHREARPGPNPNSTPQFSPSPVELIPSFAEDFLISSSMNNTQALKASMQIKFSPTAKTISRSSVSGLVFGYPFDRDEDFPIAWGEAKRFVDDLAATRKFQGMNYTFWDETYTTTRVFNNLKEISKPLKFIPMAPKTMTDEYAAFEILERYLRFFNRDKDQTFEEGERDLYKEFGQPKLK